MGPVDKVVYRKSLVLDCNTLAYRKSNHHNSGRVTGIIRVKFLNST